jgi:3-hydroxyisobutyrate dehydrogenase-like beta-hydroxyacid dehydrogenase
MAIPPKIGLIGAGNAGAALLQALSQHWPVGVFDRDAGRYSGLSSLCRHAPEIADSAASLAARCQLVILSLPSPQASLEVAAEIAAHLSPGAVLLETSTVTPQDIEALAGLAAPSGARVIDAAIVGGVAKLASGEGAFLVGSPEAEAGMAGEILRAISDEIFFLARRGDGMRTKLAVNAVAHAVYVVLVEAGALAAAQDIPLGVFQRLLERESGLMRPLTHRFAERLRSHDFAGGMSSLNARKDSALALSAAADLGVPVPVLTAAHGVYEQAVAAGLGSVDYAAIGSLWEHALGISFKAGDFSMLLEKKLAPRVGL